MSNTTLLPFISTKLKQMPTQAKVWFAVEVKAERTNKLSYLCFASFPNIYVGILAWYKKYAQINDRCQNMKETIGNEN